MPKHRRVSLTRRLRRCQPGTGMRKIERANGVTHDDTTDRPNGGDTNRRPPATAAGRRRTATHSTQRRRLRRPPTSNIVHCHPRPEVPNEPGLWREGARIFTTIIMVALRRPRRRRRGSTATLRAGRKDRYPSHRARSCPVCPTVPRWVASVPHRRYHWLHWPPAVTRKS